MKKQKMKANIKTILLIEDDEGLIELLTERIIESGHQTIHFKNGRNAIEWLKFHSPFLIILDFSLPDMNGKEFIDEVTTIGLNLAPFIVSTGQGDERIAVDMMKLGAKDYVIKDIHFLEMIPLIIARVSKEIENESKLRLVEQALIESNQFNKQIIQSAQEGIIVYDREMKYQVWNPYMEGLSGISASDIIGKDPTVYFPFLKDFGVYDIVSKALDGILSTEIDIPYTLQTGKTGWSSNTTAPVYDSFGNIVGAITTVRDITERKEAEILLHKKSLESQQLNEELIKTNAELKKEKEHAEESDRLKTAFLANMSHEIRTPMNGILGFAELLKKPDLTDDKQQLYLGIIEKSGSRMLNIINDIIDISKIESGLMKTTISETNINKLIEFIYTFFKPEIENKGMELRFHNDLSSQNAIIRTDREKIYAILINIVKNSIKYCDKGSIEFGYKQKGSTLEFFVHDTGIGIPIDRQQAIFERFIQADISDKRAFQGAGLGLAISKAYIEMLGGKIWVKSEPGKGSTFYFTLPSNLDDKTTIHKNYSKMNDNDHDPIKKLKVLIAEDDETSSMLLAELIDVYAKEILYAKTGIEAVSTCQKNTDIDLVLMDIKMPDMGGYEATKEIRKFNKELIIIAQTAFALSGDIDKALTSGCNDYISKPLKQDVLKGLLKKYFEK